MTLVFPIGTGGTFDRLPADQTLKHGAHDFQFHHASLLSHVPDPRFVHADAICALTNHEDGAAAVRDALGEGFAYVEWIRPGFKLSKLV